MTYAVKEIFYTLQGEGRNTGRAAIFCRFSGCNLWSGRHADRETALCYFCDTDFVGTDGPGGGKFQSAQELADAIQACWPLPIKAGRLVVLTGGEPLLQVDEFLVDALHARGFEVALETNGTLPSPAGVDWICVSPKPGSPLVITKGNELKLVFPQIGVEPDRFEALAFEHFLLQPMDGPAKEENTKATVAFCLANPQWRLSLQTHKFLGIP